MFIVKNYTSRQESTKLYIQVKPVIISKIFVKFNMEGWKRIEKYQFNLNKVIGQGSYATVYWGKSIDTCESVAVKVIDKKLFLNAYNLKNIQSQIDIMKMVNHENIVKLHDIYQTTNNMYIITQFCEDGDLYHFLLQKKKLPESQAKKYLKQIMKGAKYLHSNGVIHRDLKPANILMKNGVCKISDFGFAKSLQYENAVMKSIVGTPLYMSPQILKRCKYTSKSDLWSIGLIYYQMLHGKTPWPANNQMQLINAINQRKPTFSRDISDLSKDFIMKCLEVEQSQRIGWEQVFEHKLIQDTTKIHKTNGSSPQDKENLSSNFTQNLRKRQSEGSQNPKQNRLKKQLSQKALKIENLTPVRKRMTKTPTNGNKTAGKSINNKIKSILAITPKKIDQIKMPLN